MSTAAEILDYADALNIELTVKGGRLSCDFSQSTANNEVAMLDLIKQNKAALTALLNEQSANDPSIAPNLPTQPPQAYVEALDILDRLLVQNKGKPLLWKQWREAVMYYFGCHEAESYHLTHDISADKWVRFYDWYQYVERTTPLEQWHRQQAQAQAEQTQNRCRLNPPFKCGRCEGCLRG